MKSNSFLPMIVQMKNEFEQASGEYCNGVRDKHFIKAAIALGRMHSIAQTIIQNIPSIQCALTDDCEDWRIANFNDQEK